ALHPDINKSENASESFILVNEAYEMLLEYKQWPLDKIARYWQQTETLRKQEARKRAAHYARKSYYEFKKSKTYQSANYVFYFFDMLFFFTGILIMIVPIIFADFSELEPEPAISMGILIVMSFIFGFLLALASLKSVLDRFRFKKK
ncbi:MAG: hypothetical protein ACOC31_01635, partial [Bacteroidota bacterium]